MEDKYHWLLVSEVLNIGQYQYILLISCRNLRNLIHVVHYNIDLIAEMILPYITNFDISSDQADSDINLANYLIK